MTTPSGCRYGNGRGPKVLMVAGDSHAAAWAPVMETLANQGRFTLEYNTRDSCSIQDRGLTGESTEVPSCLRWKKNVVAKIKKNPPDVLLLSYYTYTKPITLAAHEAAMRDLLRQIPRHTQVVFIRDTPRFSDDVMQCLQQNLDRPGACAVLRKDSVDEQYFPINKKLAKEFGAKVLDMNDYICDANYCYPAIGDTTVVKDAHHLARGFAQKMTPALLAELRRIGILR
ncbi:SGNH hydrolase domain-containing protein [Arcanobacterium wilhelmae]|uniref:SGNH hydrolase domain-containing protein n=1 Tax=Arcanobacterium wilhelmae TaxID=1803177 RepID=UPI00241559D7|nr:SGNH hydrolase domain-containing protein [Arcanobacterium wilhelmae]WFN91132.1 SGNH hydrolase domain-containing protein [Arcanobacterium wilhelmae]